MELQRERHDIEYQTKRECEDQDQSIWILPQRVTAGDAFEVRKLQTQTGKLEQAQMELDIGIPLTLAPLAIRTVT